MLRPYGQGVWIGYDPAKGSQHGDSAGCVVIAPPKTPGGKFRILEHFQWRGLDFRAQAAAIQQLTTRYQVDYIGLDATGIGHGVLQYVRDFFPQVKELIYNPALKNALVLKAYDVISHHRLEYDAGAQDITRALWPSDAQQSPVAIASHADLAWETMHALYHEPLIGDGQNTKPLSSDFNMRKTKKRTLNAPKNRSVDVFIFGDPVRVLDRHEIFDYLECSLIDNYYEPPMSFEGLSRIFRAAAHHSSAIYVKHNILSSTFVPHKLLRRQDLDRFALDFLIFGNAYLER